MSNNSECSYSMCHQMMCDCYILGCVKNIMFRSSGEHDIMCSVM